MVQKLLHGPQLPLEGAVGTVAEKDGKGVGGPVHAVAFVRFQRCQLIQLGAGQLRQRRALCAGAPVGSAQGRAGQGGRELFEPLLVALPVPQGGRAEDHAQIRAVFHGGVHGPAGFLFQRIGRAELPGTGGELPVAGDQEPGEGDIIIDQKPGGQTVALAEAAAQAAVGGAVFRLPAHLEFVDARTDISKHISSPRRP